MRHIYVNRATYALAALLVLGVFAFAWMRSRGIVIAAREGTASVTTEGASWDWQELGEQVYADNCSGCHAELPHVSEVFTAEDGRSYLISFMLFGYEGEVVTEGDRQGLTHRPFADLADDEVAASLNHMLVSWGSAEQLPDDVDYYEPSEIRQAREQELSPEEVASLRPSP